MRWGDREAIDLRKPERNCDPVALFYLFPLPFPPLPIPSLYYPIHSPPHPSSQPNPSTLSYTRHFTPTPTPRHLHPSPQPSPYTPNLPRLSPIPIPFHTFLIPIPIQHSIPIIFDPTSPIHTRPLIRTHITGISYRYGRFYVVGNVRGGVAAGGAEEVEAASRRSRGSIRRKMCRRLFLLAIVIYLLTSLTRTNGRRLHLFVLLVVHPRLV